MVKKVRQGMVKFQLTYKRKKKLLKKVLDHLKDSNSIKCIRRLNVMMTDHTNIKNVFQEVATGLEESRGQEVRDTSTLNREVVCPKCNGHLFMYDEANNERCYCPDCWPRVRKKQFLKNSGIPKDRQSCTFDDFSVLPGTKNAYKAAGEICSINTDVRLIIIYGDTGNGKTHLAYASALQCIDNGIAVRVITCPDWLDDVKRAMRRSNGTCDAMIESVQQVPHLVIDELDISKVRQTEDSEFEIQTLDRLICRREREAKRTLITTNWNRQHIEEVFPRVLSRASDPQYGRIILNKGADFRKRQR